MADNRNTGLNNGLRWIDGMDDSVSEQKKLLRLFLYQISSDDTFEWLQLSCSLARKAGDKLSDIDTAVGIKDDQYQKGIEKLKKLVKSLMPVAELLEHGLTDELGRATRHLIVVYKSSLQLSILTMPSSWIPGLRPMAVTLYDPGNHLAVPESEHPSYKDTTPAQAKQWNFLAWLNLIDMTKYLDRESPWEANMQLERARNHTWNLWAVANGLDYATYGITQVLDDNISFPEDIENTVSSLDLDEIRKASHVLVSVLQEVSKLASDKLPYDMPLGIEDIALKRLYGKL